MATSGVSDAGAALTIIVPNWNGAVVLPHCLESLVRYGGARTEVIVFDNGSDDGSVAILETYRHRLNLRVLTSTVNLGYAAACNRAAEVARAPVLLLLNNDAVLTGRVDAALNYLGTHTRVAICQAPLLTADGRSIDSAGSLVTPAGFLYHLAIGRPAAELPASRAVFAVKGAAMFVRAAALGGLGLFDRDAFAYFEESDLCWRLQVMGWDVTYVRELPAVLHLGGYTASKLPSGLCEFHSFKNRLRSVLKNAERRTLVTMLARHVVVAAGAAADGLVRGRPGSARIVVRALVWNLRHARDTRQLRQAVQRHRQRSDEEIFASVGTTMRLRDFYRQRRAYAEARTPEFDNSALTQK